MDSIRLELTIRHSNSSNGCFVDFLPLFFSSFVIFLAATLSLLVDLLSLAWDSVDLPAFAFM